MSPRPEVLFLHDGVGRLLMREAADAVLRLRVVQGVLGLPGDSPGTARALHGGICPWSARCRADYGEAVGGASRWRGSGEAGCPRSCLSLSQGRGRPLRPCESPGWASAVLDGDVGEAVAEVGDFLPGCCVVEGDGVAAGVGSDDADGGGAGLDEGGECELGEGDVGLEAGVAVVGGVDAFASGQEGQPVGGVCCGFVAAVLAS